MGVADGTHTELKVARIVKRIEPKTPMDWNLLAISFITVFISELGDKSQLAAIALSSNAKSVRPIFLGASSALLLASFLGVWLGGGLGDFLPVRLVKAIAALGFAIMAVRLLWNDDSSTVMY